MTMLRSSVLFSLIALFSFGSVGLVACNDSGGSNSKGNGGAAGDDNSGGLLGTGKGGSGSGDEGSGGKTSTTNECTAQLDSSAEACETCVASSCCDEYSAIVNSSDADEFMACYDACSSNSCVASCVTDYPTAGGNFEEFVVCGNNSCDSECNSDPDTDPVQNECYDSTETDSCNICLASSCCDELASVVSSSDSDGFITCIGSCSTQSCLATCEDEYPIAGGNYQDFESCGNTSCASSCSS
jgi:hypothetical protein